jgi:hypothetical protein
MSYSISWDQETASIQVIIPHDTVARLPTVTNTPLVALLRSNLRLAGSFSGEYDADFGFGGALKYTCTEDAVRYSGALPHHEIAACYICNGTGRRDVYHFDEPCLLCRGARKAPVIQWESLHLLRGSFKALFFVLNYPPEDGSFFDELQPDMEIDLGVQLTQNGAWLKVGLSEPLVSWLASVSGGERSLVDAVSCAMKQAFCWMTGDEGSFLYHLRARLESGMLRLDVPGNASGVYMSRGVGGETPGVIYSHNMDTGPQQFTCLAGMGQVHKLYKEAGHGGE